MSYKNFTYILLIVVLAAFAVALWVYPQVPNQVAVHWNVAGEADGFTGKFWGLFLMPFIILIIFLMYYLIPRLDPLRENIEKFRRVYDYFWLLVMLFLLYVFTLTILWNLEWRFDFTLALAPALAILWYSIGSFLERTKRNWFMGVRTPWTLSSDFVWDKTHKLSGLLFKIAGVISLLATFSGQSSIVIWSVMISAVLASIISIGYSFFVYRQEKNNI